MNKFYEFAQTFQWNTKRAVKLLNNFFLEQICVKKKILSPKAIVFVFVFTSKLGLGMTFACASLELQKGSNPEVHYWLRSIHLHILLRCRKVYGSVLPVCIEIRPEVQIPTLFFLHRCRSTGKSNEAKTNLKWGR